MMKPSPTETRAARCALSLKRQFFSLPLKTLATVLDSALPCMLSQLFAFIGGTLHLIFWGEVPAMQQDAKESSSKCAKLV